jgi:predicted dithiol-disulfide oxidoreductase (DUF899 family)
MPKHKVVSRDEWLLARKDFLRKEKEFSRLQDELSWQRRELPWVKVDKTYVFETASGQQSLKELFKNRSQLIVYHFMLHPTWEEGCSGCSFVMDNLPARMEHLDQKDVQFVAVSLAPLDKIEAFKRRMEWNFQWISSNGSDFNFDYGVSFTPEQISSGKVTYNYNEVTQPLLPEREGLSVFIQEEGAIYHTYSTYARGVDVLLGTYHYLDLTPKGRDEEGGMSSWVKLRYKYQPRS